jgi:hypothetical protein
MHALRVELSDMAKNNPNKPQAEEDRLKNAEKRVLDFNQRPPSNTRAEQQRQ